MSSSLLISTAALWALSLLLSSVGTCITVICFCTRSPTGAGAACEPCSRRKQMTASNSCLLTWLSGTNPVHNLMARTFHTKLATFYIKCAFHSTNMRFSVNFNTFSFICDGLHTFINTSQYRLCCLLHVTLTYCRPYISNWQEWTITYFLLTRHIAVNAQNTTSEYVCSLATLNCQCITL